MTVCFVTTSGARHTSLCLDVQTTSHYVFHLVLKIPVSASTAADEVANYFAAIEATVRLKLLLMWMVPTVAGVKLALTW